MLVEGVEKGNQRTRGAAIRTIDVLVSPAYTSEASDNLEALRRLRAERILVNALDDPEVSVLAALILARLGVDAGADELVRAATADDPKFGTIVSRHYAMAALNVLGHPQYLPVLAKALEHPEQRVRLDAALAMRSFAHPSMYDVWNTMWRGNGADDVRYWAFQGLVALRGSERELLRAGLVDRESGIRLTAAERLLALGFDAAAVEALEALATDPSHRARALRYLSARGDPRSTAILARSHLPKAVDDDARMRPSHYDPGTRFAVVNVLGALQDRESVPTLSTLLGSDLNLNSVVVRALVAIGDDAARRALIQAMDSGHASARIHAAGGVLSVYDR